MADLVEFTTDFVFDFLYFELQHTPIHLGAKMPTPVQIYHFVKGFGVVATLVEVFGLYYLTSISALRLKCQLGQRSTNPIAFGVRILREFGFDLTTWKINYHSRT